MNVNAFGHDLCQRYGPRLNACGPAAAQAAILPFGALIGSHAQTYGHEL